MSSGKTYFITCVGMCVILIFAVMVTLPPCAKYTLLNEKGIVLYENIKNKETCDQLMKKYSPNGLCIEQ